VAHAVFVGAGCVLLAAAALKAHDLYHDPLATDPFLPTSGLMVAVVFEVGVGVWLVAGVYPGAARAVAATLFGLFGVVSLARALHGEASCGCFGRLSVTPWLMFALDVCLAVALVSLRGPDRPASHARRVALAVVAVAAAGAAAWFLPGDPANDRLVIDPPTVQLGQVHRGERKTASVTLTNRGGHPVTITATRTSCPCLSIHLPARVVAPHQSVQVVLEYDSSREPDFTGRLLVAAEGLDQGGRLLFQATLRLAVE
jgi:hypothetical protein